MDAATATGAACARQVAAIFYQPQILAYFLAWDQAATIDNSFALDPASTATASAATTLDLSSFTTPELELIDYAPFLESFQPAPPLFDPTFFDLSSVPVPTLSSADTSLSNTPATALIHTPPSGPSSPEGGGSAAAAAALFFPGLKLPQQQQPQQPAKSSSRPGRKPKSATSASSSSSYALTHTASGRITKPSHHTTTSSQSPPNTAPVSDDAPDVLLRRQRNNLAAKRYRQKKIDRIEELEGEVEVIKRERDELRIRLARQEAEVAALREMLQMNMRKEHGGSGSGSEGGEESV